MELRQLQHFVDVVHHGSITAAAAASHISQPAISVAIRKLEKDLGVMLLHRTPQGVEMTRAGEALLPRAEVILAQATASVSAVRAAAGEGPRHLRLAIPPLVGMAAIFDLVERYGPEHPEVDLSIVELGTREVLERLERGEADIGVALVPDDMPRLHVWSVTEVPIVGLVSPTSSFATGSVLRLADLDGEPIVVVGAGAHITPLVLARIRETGARPYVGHTTVQLNMLVELTRKGLGVSFVPANLASIVEGVRVLPVEPPLTERVAVVVAESLELNEPLRHLLDRITMHVGVE